MILHHLRDRFSPAQKDYFLSSSTTVNFPVLAAATPARSPQVAGPAREAGPGGRPRCDVAGGRRGRITTRITRGVASGRWHGRPARGILEDIEIPPPVLLGHALFAAHHGKVEKWLQSPMEGRRLFHELPIRFSSQPRCFCRPSLRRYSSN